MMVNHWIIYIGTKHDESIAIVRNDLSYIILSNDDIFYYCNIPNSIKILRNGCLSKKYIYLVVALDPSYYAFMLYITWVLIVKFNDIKKKKKINTLTKFFIDVFYNYNDYSCTYIILDSRT